MDNRFIGSFEYSIDSKGRVNIPAKFRKALSKEANETFVISFAADNRLRVYPMDEWTKIEEANAKLPKTPKNLKYLRVLSQSLSETTLDSQGRITLTPKHLKYAGIEKKVALVGLSSERCIEICIPENLIDIEDEDFSDLFYGAMESADE